MTSRAMGGEFQSWFQGGGRGEKLEQSGREGGE